MTRLLTLLNHGHMFHAYRSAESAMTGFHTINHNKHKISSFQDNFALITNHKIYRKN